jgi:hypothetical protein
MSLALGACSDDSEKNESGQNEDRTTATESASEKTQPKKVKAGSGLKGVVKAIADTVRQERAAIGQPVLDEAVASGRLTQPEAAQLGAIFAQAGSGEKGKKDKPSGAKFDPCDADVRAVRDEMNVAVARRRLQLARPLIRQAVRNKEIDKREALMLRRAYKRAQDPRPPKIDPCDEDIRALSQEARQAFRDDGKKSAFAVIDKALEGERISEDQATILKRRVVRTPKKKEGDAE